MSANRPIPLPTSDTRPFWEAARAGRLDLPFCPACSLYHYPPPPRCPACLSSNMEWRTLSGRGRLHSWAVIHTDLSAGIAPPFVVGEIELAEQSKLIMVALVVGTKPDALRAQQELRISFVDSADPGIAYPQFEVLA